MIIAGIDEAGKGSVFGSLWIACYVIDDSCDIQAGDSKKYSKKKRESMYHNLVEQAIEVQVYEITATELNTMHENGMTLIEMEQWAMAMLINSLQSKPEKIYIDAADVNEQRFGFHISNSLNFQCNIISEHNADNIFPVVGAASIIAKVSRDNHIHELKQFYDAEIGSGYPSDKKTRNWLLEYYNRLNSFPKETRLFWNTVNKIIQESNTSK